MELSSASYAPVNEPKKYYRFHEVATLTSIKPYVLRFWESEFPEISPLTDDSGVKMYSSLDVRAIEEIKKLLFKEKLSIPQAKLKLEECLMDHSPQKLPPTPQQEQMQIDSNTQQRGESRCADFDTTRLCEARALLSSAVRRITTIKKKYSW